jgi:hypothetical protein
MIYLANGATTLTLPIDLHWSDEFDWHAVEQSVDRSLTGGLIVQTQARDGGRPITLRPEDSNSAWMTRSMLETIQGWAAISGLELSLTIRGVARTVVFRHHEGPAVEARPVVHFNEVDGTDYYVVTLRLMEL